MAGTRTTGSPLPPVEKFVACRSLPGLADNTAHRMQCPLDFVAVGAIVTAGASLAQDVESDHQKYDDWSVVPNLGVGWLQDRRCLKPFLKEAMRHIDLWKRKPGKSMRTN